MKAVSIVFHPLLISSYVLALFYFYLPELFSPVATDAIPMLLLATLITTFIIPALSISIMKMTSRITSMELSNREERILPFISISIFYGAATYMFITKLYITPPLSIMLIGVSTLIVLLLLITFRFKISIHAAAIWGACGFLTALSNKMMGTQLIIPVIACFFVAGLVSSSRLYLNSHTSGEVWTGSALGFVFCYGIMFVFG